MSGRRTPEASSDASARVCTWCGRQLSAGARADASTCSRKCRQAVWRLRQHAVVELLTATPMRFAYADPPYPGRARRYYQMPEVNHRLLIAHLEEIAPDGWALSTAADALRDVLPLCPEGARVCAWVKPIGACPLTHGLHNTWEPLVVVRGRQVRPGKRDWLQAQPARGGGELPGRKPLAFCAWLWSCLGAAAGDSLIDVFPGTGIVGRAWAELSAAPALATPSRRARATDVAEVLSDLSAGAPGDALGLSSAAVSDK